MKFVLIVLLIPCISFAQMSKEEIELHRKEHKESLSDTAMGILTSEDLLHFHGVDYFDFDSSFQIWATFTKDKGKWFEMPTSTERLPVYRRFGYVDFNIDSSEYRLSIYQSKDLRKDKEYRHYLFIPFRDGTTRVTTYGGGRYLETEIPEENEILLDFNLAFNPYCSYSHRFSCPIPPQENTLDVEIMAGEKTPLGH